MTVLFDATRHRLIFTLNGSHISHPCHLTRYRVREDDLVGNLLLRILRCLYVDGNLLVVVADAATDGCDTLSLKAREKHLLANAIGLQALTINIKTYLLLLFTKHFHVGNRGNTTQSVAQVVAILFQFPIAALVACNGNQQGRGVAKVVVYDNGQHPTGQLSLIGIESMLQLTPHLILVVHVVVQAHHHDAHAVLRRGGGLGAIYLAKGKEIAL